MGLSTSSLNQKGYAACTICRKKKFVSELETCAVCGKFVCKDCATYRRQGNPYGYVCKRCMQKLDE